MASEGSSLVSDVNASDHRIGDDVDNTQVDFDDIVLRRSLPQLALTMALKKSVKSQRPTLSLRRSLPQRAMTMALKKSVKSQRSL